MADNIVKLDATDRKILAILQKEARITFKEIGEAVSMTRPAVRERVLRLEATGIISGYHAEIDTDALGWNLHVMVSFRFNSDFRYTKKPNDVLISLLNTRAEVVQYWEVYGDLDFLIEAAFRTKDSLHQFLDELRTYGFVRSHLIAMHAKRLYLEPDTESGQR